jgi:hypothetical protein
MMDVNIQAKKMLAKLLAIENLHVIHAGTKTATFDPKRRILTLPIWKDMSGDLYDLLVLHEVSHALFSPQGSKIIIDACLLIDPKFPKFAKRFINIVEDARIEKLIKIKYPGGKGSFIRGYVDLVNRNFFGTKDNDINSYGVIDRLNIYFKTGNTEIFFNEKEQEFIKEIEQVLTFNDVVNICIRLYQYAKEEKKQQKEDTTEKESKQEEKISGSDEEEDDINVDPDEDDLDEIESEETKKTSTSEKADESKKTSETNETSETEIETPVESLTDQTWEKSQTDLFDENARNIQYLGIPEPKLDQIIIPYKQVHKEIRNFYLSLDEKNKSERILQHTQEFERFKEENKPVVNWLLKEFELYKAASQYARVQTSKIGILDMNRLSQYKLTDDIMKKITSIPGGKNHALEIFVDWSGSMKDHIMGTIHQLINLVMFAKRAQIPFNVYTFGAYKIHSNEKANEIAMHANLDAFIHQKNDYAFYVGFSLRQILTDKMSASEFNDACINLLMMVSGVSFGTTFKKAKFKMPGLPKNDMMGGTPLNESIVSAMAIVDKLRKKTRTQVINVIFITDGMATTDHRFVYNEFGDCSYIKYKNEDIYLQDKVTHTDYKLDEENNTKQFLQILKNRVHVNVIGFFISNKENCLQWNKNTSLKEQYQKELDTNYFISIPDMGYTEFFVIPGDKRLEITLNKDSINKSIGNNMLVFAMVEYGLKQRKQRVLLTRFIKIIS